MLHKSNSIAIIGAGLTGSLLAVCLSKKGFNVEVYEQRGDIRKNVEFSKRTIAMSLSARGLKVLKKLNLDDEINQIITPTYGRAIHIDNNNIKLKDYGNGNQAIYTIRRSDLNQLLINKAEQSGKVKFFFKQQIEKVDIYNNDIIFTKGSKKTYRYIFGADGVNSKVREVLVKEKIIKVDKNELNIGYKQMALNFSAITLSKMVATHVHVWTNKVFVFVALPSMKDKSFLANLFMPVDELIKLNTLGKNTINNFFSKNFPNLEDHITELVDQYIKCPLSKMFTVKCNKWNYSDKILLIGDSCHAIAPFYAMGMNLCFEDCYVFDKLLDEYDLDIGKVIALFSDYRKNDTDAMAKMALNNFNNLCNSKERKYDKLWDLERNLSKNNPKYFSQYSLIAFNDTIPLSKVLEMTTNNDQDLLI